MKPSLRLKVLRRCASWIILAGFLGMGCSSRSIPFLVRPTPSPSMGNSPSSTPDQTPSPGPTRAPTRTPSPSELSGWVVYDDLVDHINFVSQIFLANLDTGEIKQLTSVGSNLHPVWSPDGEQIVFMSDRDGNFDLYIMNADGRNEQQLTNYPGDESLPDWSPDGNRIVFVSDHEGNKEIYVIDLNTRNVTRLTDEPSIDFSPRWSSDGRRIAFVSHRNRTAYSFQVYIMNADGSSVEQLTTDKYSNGKPVWCPDDTCIVYERYTGSRSNISKLMIMDLKTRVARPLLTGSDVTAPEIQEWRPSRSPVTGYIVFSIWGKGLLYAFDPSNDRLFSLGLQATDASLFP